MTWASAGDRTLHDRTVLVRVWDLPTRLFHWGVVALIVTAWVTQYENWMTLHMLGGYTMLAALLFRLIWGMVGSDTARFRHFVRSPLAALIHLRNIRGQSADAEVGHNVAGGWMVLVMLLLLMVQVGSGLCANDEISVEGPLAHVVGSHASDWLSHIHAVNFDFIEAAIVLHVLAIAAYRALRGQNLVLPMITGNKRLPTDIPQPRMAKPALALALFVVTSGLVAFGVGWFGG